MSSARGNPGYPYYGHDAQRRSPATGKQSPPPLQHPVPQHPIPNFNNAVHRTSPPPNLQQQQQYQYQPTLNHGPYQPGTPQNMYSQFGFNDPTTQLGIQFAGNAMAQGTAYMERNLNRWINIPALRHYFNVNNSYVVAKLKLILFPWRHTSWRRSILRTETGQMEGFKPAREDVNSPDLYIPVMAVVTYILLCGLAAGQQGSFHPEKLYTAGSISLAVIFSELVYTRLGYYFLNIPFEASTLDLIAYSGYKYVCIIVVDFVKLLGSSKWLWLSVYTYTAASVGFFLLRSMRYVILPDVARGTSTLSPQRKRRMWFLVIIAALQSVYMFFLMI